MERARGAGVGALGLVTTLDIAGKKFGPNSLFTMPTYRPDFSVERFLAASDAHMNQLFYAGHWFTPFETIGLRAALFGVLSLLPVDFLPPREGFV
ncbi:MAG: hypothetical protein ACREH9_08290, partial [Pseudomonadota bacterium]